LHPANLVPVVSAQENVYVVAPGATAMTDPTGVKSPSSGRKRAVTIGAGACVVCCCAAVRAGRRRTSILRRVEEEVALACILFILVFSFFYLFMVLRLMNFDKLKRLGI
jgi:hypothetical protein